MVTPGKPVLPLGASGLVNYPGFRNGLLGVKPLE